MRCVNGCQPDRSLLFSIPRMKPSAWRESVPALLCLLLTACAAPDRLLYDQQDIRIGIQQDPTVNRSTSAGRNSHPAQLTPEQVRLLLGSLQVSGWSGSLMGFLVTPTAIPVFKLGELRVIEGPISRALAAAGQDERVFFTLPNQKTSYNDDRITGALAVRGPYLHFVLTDHSAFTRGDTAGGDDPRDTKGMKLFVANPAKPAQLVKSEEPHWGPYEKVHLSIAIHEVLALNETSNMPAASAASVTGESSPEPLSGQPIERSEDLHLQVQELTTSNLELKKRLEEQSSQMTELKNELQMLQKELKKGKPKSSRTPPLP
jgi:hypothetical protein